MNKFRNLAVLTVGAAALAATVNMATAQTMVIATDRQGSLMNRVGTAMANR